MTPVNVLIFQVAGRAISAKIAVHYAALFTLGEVALVAEEGLSEAEDAEVVVGVQCVGRLRLCLFGLLLLNLCKVTNCFHLENSFFDVLCFFF